MSKFIDDPTDPAYDPTRFVQPHHLRLIRTSVGYLVALFATIKAGLKREPLEAEVIDLINRSPKIHPELKKLLKELIDARYQVGPHANHNYSYCVRDLWSEIGKVPLKPTSLGKRGQDMLALFQRTLANPRKDRGTDSIKRLLQQFDKRRKV